LAHLFASLVFDSAFLVEYLSVFSARLAQSI
jgi:hypothetical protein